MPSLYFGPPFDKLKDKPAPHTLAPSELAIALNTQYDTYQIEAATSPTPDDSLPVPGVSTVRFMWHLNPEIAAPTSAPETALTVAPGPMTGTYYYVTTFLDAQGRESLPGPASIGLAVAGVAVSVTSIPLSAESKVTSRRLYRRTGTKGDTFRLITTFNDNTTTTYTDVTPDGTATSLSQNWKFWDEFASGFEYNGTLFYAYEAGDKAPRKWDGVNDYRLGIDPPGWNEATRSQDGTATPTAIINGDYLDGVDEGYLYQYCYTYVTDKGEESAPSYVSTAVDLTLASGPKAIGINNMVASSDPQVVTKRLYRTGGTGQWQLVQEVPNATVNTNDLVPNALLSAETLTSDTYFPPVYGEGTCLHAGSLWLWKGDRLYFSEPGFLHAFPATNYIRFPAPVRAAVSWGAELLVLLSTHEYLVVGQDADTYQSVPLSSSLGCVTGRSVRITEHGVVWVSNLGLGIYSSGAPSLMSLDLSDTRWQDIANPYDGVIPVTGSAYHNGFYILFGSMSNGDLVADLRQGPGQARFADRSTGTLQGYGIYSGSTITASHRDSSTGLLYVALGGDQRLLKYGDYLIPEMLYGTGEYAGDGPDVEEFKLFKNLKFVGEVPVNEVADVNFLGEPQLDGSGNLQMIPGPQGLEIYVFIDGQLEQVITLTSRSDLTKHFPLKPGLRGRRIQLFFYGVFRLTGLSVSFEYVRRP